jgi:hypothetical protein
MRSSWEEKTLPIVTSGFIQPPSLISTMNSAQAWAAYLLALPWMSLNFLLVPSKVSKSICMVLAMANAAYALLIPVYLMTPYPFCNVLLRLPYGYLAMQVLDPVIARRNDPPILKDQGKLPTTFHDHLRYTYDPHVFASIQLRMTIR